VDSWIPAEIKASSHEDNQRKKIESWKACVDDCSFTRFNEGSDRNSLIRKTKGRQKEDESYLKNASLVHLLLEVYNGSSFVSFCKSRQIAGLP